jgi:hypothetical protein
MAKLMNTWPSTAGGLDPRGLQQCPEHAVNFPVHERLPIVGNEDMVTTPPHLLTVHQVASQPLYGSIVQWHQSGFLELGFANQQTIGSDVGDPKM